MNLRQPDSFTRRRERRSPESATPQPGATLREIKGALSRPLAFERRDGQLRLVLVERRRAPRGAVSSDESRIGAALRAHIARRAGLSRGLDALAAVSTRFEALGWAGIAGLDPALLDRAVAQAEALAQQEPGSELLSTFVVELRRIAAEAQARAQRHAVRRWPAGGEVLVAEATAEEFEAAARGWAGTEPGELDPPAPRRTPR